MTDELHYLSLVDSGKKIAGGEISSAELTAAMLAARRGRVEVLRELIRRGADLEARDEHGQTAFTAFFAGTGGFKNLGAKLV